MSAMKLSDKLKEVKDLVLPGETPEDLDEDAIASIEEAPLDDLPEGEESWESFEGVDKPFLPPGMSEPEQPEDDKL